MSDLPAPPPASPSPGKGFPVGRFVVGLVVLAIGVAALLQALDVSIEIWKVVLPGALIAVGLGLIVAGLRSGRNQGGLVSIGVILTVVLTIVTVVGIPFEGGVGDRVVRPSSQSQVRGEYRLAVGQLTIDLTNVAVTHGPGPPARHIQARLGIGQLVVIVPFNTPAEVRGHAGIGDVTIFGRSSSGLDVDKGWDPFVPAGVGLAYSLDLSVGVGQVEVRYG
jgi:hypothetical protein